MVQPYLHLNLVVPKIKILAAPLGSLPLPKYSIIELCTHRCTLSLLYHLLSYQHGPYLLQMEVCEPNILLHGKTHFEVSITCLERISVISSMVITFFHAS
ncbi:unnamed protein product, partial [Vitis vinifera]